MNTYSQKEEKINVISHAIGIGFGVIALLLLLIKGFLENDLLKNISYTVFAVSMILLYTASTLYHNSKKEDQRKYLKVFDHASIFVLIAGTYTPFSLITLEGETGWIIFGVVLSIGLFGISIKLFFTGRFKIVSTILYVFMGWVIIFAIKPLINNLSSEGLFWLFAGGVAYTIGAVLYSIKKIPYNHAIFHILVLLGTICHFVAVYFYV